VPEMRNQSKKNLQLFILCGIFNTISLNLYQPFTVKFLQRLGGDEFHISLLNSLPGLMGIIFSLPGAVYMLKNTRKSMKRHTIEFLFYSRILIAGFALMLFLPVQLAPIVFVILFGFKSFPEAISQTAYQGFTGDLFNERFRSTAISLRFKLSMPIAIIVTLLSGIILKSLPQSEGDLMILYQIFFIAAAVFGLLETFSYLLIKEPKNIVSRESIKLRDVLKTVFKHKDFMSFTKSSLLFYFGWQMGWPLFNIYQVVNLGADELWLSILTVVTSVGQFFGFSYWNRMIQKKGNAIVASITTLGMASNPILLAISPNLYWASALNFISGFFTAGNVTVLLNALLESTPDENRVIYVGTYNTLINISLMISPIVAHFVMNQIGIIWALVIVSLIRLAGSVVFYFNHGKRKANQAA
jgi:hypothetical protein